MEYPLRIVNCWRENFADLFHDVCVANMDIIRKILLREIVKYMSNTSSIEKLNIPSCKLRSSKAIQLYVTRVEILKAGGDISSESYKLITRVWNKSFVQQERINDILFSVYKGKLTKPCVVILEGQYFWHISGRYFQG